MSIILAIDDKQDNLVSVSALLRHFIPGCRVITALSGLEGIRKAKEEKPDTVLLDLHMPGMDGFQICEQLKKSPETRHIPIIMFTAVRTDSKSRVKGLEMGADAFLAKPIDEVELAAQIKAMLRIKKAEDLLRQKKEALEVLVKERLEALRENEEKYRKLYEKSSETAELYRSLIHSSADAIIICDLEDKVQYVSPTFTQTFGWTLEEIKDNQIPYLPGGHDDNSIEQLQKVATEGIPARAVRARRKNRDGRMLEVSISASRYNDHEGRPIGLLYIIQDITDTKRLETQLQQAQKMEAIGTLAGGIAHDFNNILGAIIGYTELSLLDLEKDHPTHQNLQDALKAANRAKNLVKQILTFSRQSKHQPSPIRLSPIIKEVLKFLRSTLPATIEIRHHIQNQVSVVLADPTQIHQIMMNLCTNAAYAMKETGGVLEVKLAEILIESKAEWFGLEPGNYIQLMVSDTGSGMDKETMTRLFEPYFTTKPQGEGTGMGLAVVHGIVQGHGGVIKVYSEPGQGSNFNIFLPVVSQHVHPVIEAEKAVPKGSERILYIDDESAIVDIGQQMLQRLGYNVDTMTDSTKALAHLKTHGPAYDLIITDQTMPKLTGAQLAQELIAIYPDLPVILCTGFSESISEERAKNIGIRAFLMKPLILKDLAVTIRSVLDGQ